MGGNKTRKHWNVLEDQADWIEKEANRLGVSESLIARRALAYYKKEGMDKDQFLRAQTKGDV